MKLIFKNIFNLLFPGSCFLCNKELEIVDFSEICIYCFLRSLKQDTASDNICPVCAHPLQSDGSCRSCSLSQLTDKKFLSVTSLAYNRDNYQKILYHYKFNKAHSFAGVFSAIIIKKYKNYFKDFDYLVPVPLNNIKKQERGFCQVSKVVKQIGRELNIPVIKAIKKKYSGKPAQHEKDLQDRVLTAHTDFYFNKKFLNTLNNKKILLIDDIYTTGSTLNACASELLKYCQVKVHVFTFARSILQ